MKIQWTSKATVWGRIRAHVRDSAWAIDANDGIIATAGLLEGLGAAGASDRLLLFAATAATIAGGLSAGGAKWAEVAAQRESELELADQEAAALAAHPEDELARLAAHWEERGLAPGLAREVATQLSAKDALAAQLDAEHGLDEITPRMAPVYAGLGTLLAFMMGAAIPLLMTFLAPVAIEAWVIVIAVVLSLVITSLMAAGMGRISALRMLLRSLAVGLSTMGISYLVGRVLI